MYTIERQEDICIYLRKILDNSGDLLVGGIIGGFGGWLFCTIAHKAAIYLEPSTRTKRKEIKQWSVTIYVGLLTILGIVLYSTIKSW